MNTFQFLRRITQLMASSFFILFAALMSLPYAHAASSYLGTWSSIYPDSTSDNAGCQLCHGPSTQQLNPYGRDLCVLSGSIDSRIVAIQDLDSDGNGTTNIQEINANTQPGWTSGTSNPLYNRGNCSATGQTVAAPAGVGPLDPTPPPTQNQPPVADANGPYTGTVNVPVQFNGSGSSDSDGTIISYDWDFGDGSTDTGVNPTYAYSSTGTFNVTLTVTDNEGAIDSDSTTATIGQGNQAPVADANGPYTGTVGSPVQLDGTGSTDPDGTIVSYMWDFGDGSSGTGPTPTHTYSAAGTYNVTLTVTDSNNASDSSTTTATITDVVAPPPPGPTPHPEADEDQDNDRNVERDNDSERAENGDDRNNHSERDRRNRRDNNRSRDRDDD